MNKLLLLILLGITYLPVKGQEAAEAEINQTIDAWHLAAADANFEAYFNLLTDDAVFIGTDATEVWNKQAFMEFSKPYFDKGKAWNFTSIQRNVHLDATGVFAWFDELLATWMKLCRGSGVLKKVDGKWKIAHYVLSIAIPNDDVQAVIELKKENDSLLLRSLTKGQY